MILKKISVQNRIADLYKVFSPQQKKKFKWLVFFTFLSSIMDIVGLAAIIPIVGLVLTDSFYQKLIDLFPLLSNISRNGLLLYIIFLFLLLIILKNLFGLYINYLQVKFVQNVYVGSSMNVLNKIFQKSFKDIQKTNSNTWINKLSSLQMTLASSVAISTMIIINEAIIFLLTAIIVCMWNWQLFFLLVVVLFPSIGLFYRKAKNTIKMAGEQKNREAVMIYSKAQEMIFGYSDIKIAGTEKFYKKRFHEITKQFGKLQSKTDFVMFIPTRIIEVVIFLCIVIILIYGVFVLKDVEKIVTTISLFSVIAYRSIPSVNRFAVALNSITAAEYILKDGEFDWVLFNEELADITPLVFNDKIRFDNLSYRYSPDAKDVIKNLNLEIKKGEKICIIGKSGSGKSTVINNILGFLTATEGKIIVDQVQLTDDNIKSWWKIVGYVRQDVFIMNASLTENIAIGLNEEEVDKQKLERAIRLASLSELVNDLPEGVNTILSERGNNLSGGQKQRIAIARAIYKGAQVLVFDEATSALDTKTEIEITNAINELGKEELTIIIIAHRYSSLRYCDKIYKLEDGIISDTYTYEELLKTEN